MDVSEKFLHFAYAIAIAVMLPSLLSNVMGYVQLSEMTTSMIMGAFGLSLVLLGYLKFQKGLGAGLTLAGMVCVVRGILPFWKKISDISKFGIAIAIFVVLIWMLYRMMSQKGAK